MHTWGEENFDWSGLNDCINIVHNTCRRWARLGGQAKEKFGTLRFYTHFGLSLHTLFLPGYYHYGWFPRWLITFDMYVATPVLNFLFGRVWFWWQRTIYSYAYWRALNKYPHLRKEILCSADYPEFIKNVTKKDGNDLHILGWNGEVIESRYG